MKPGIHRDVTEAVYRADPFGGSFTQSLAKVLLDHSPLHAREESALADPREDFGAMAREAIAAKLTESLIGADAAIQGIVAAALAEKVDSNGNKERYSGGIPFVEWLARDLIRKAALEAVQRKVELGSIIDAAKDDGIALDYLNPLLDTMKRLSENVITYKPGAA